MRYTLEEIAVAKVFAKFGTGETVTMVIYNRTDNITETITASCTEIGTSGYFEWSFSNLNTQPTYWTQYVWVMTSNRGASVYGTVDGGGYVDYIPVTAQLADDLQALVLVR